MSLDDEQHGRTGQSSSRRWLPRMTLKDLCFLVEWMITVVKESDKYVGPSVATVASGDMMLNGIADKVQGI